MTETTGTPAKTKYLQIPKANNNGQSRSVSHITSCASHENSSPTDTSSAGPSPYLLSRSSSQRSNLNIGTRTVMRQHKYDREFQEGGGTIPRATTISEDCKHCMVFTAFGCISGNTLRDSIGAKASSDQATEMNDSATVSRGGQPQSQSSRMEYGNRPDS